MTELADLKRTLKKWENNFVLQHDRKPGKEDIDAASDEIKGAYKTYAHLKKAQTGTPAKEPAAKTQSNCATDENIAPVTNNGAAELNDEVTESVKPAHEVWGAEFDRKHSKGPDKQDNGKQSKTTDSSYFTSLGRKLYEKSVKMGSFSQSGSSWKKPVTPRRGLNTDAEVKDTEVNQGQPRDKSFTDTDLYTPFSNECTADTDEAPVIPFGKMFQKALSATKGKGFHLKATDDDDDTDVFVNKYKNQPKTKISILPDNLSKLVSGSRQQIEQEVEERLNNYDSTFEDESTPAERAEFLRETQLEEELKVRHSWDRPVKDLVIEDMRYCQKTGSKKKTGSGTRKAKEPLAAASVDENRDVRDVSSVVGDTGKAADNDDSEWRNTDTPKVSKISEDHGGQGKRKVGGNRGRGQRNVKRNTPKHGDVSADVDRAAQDMEKPSDVSRKSGEVNAMGEGSDVVRRTRGVKRKAVIESDGEEAVDREQTVETVRDDEGTQEDWLDGKPATAVKKRKINTGAAKAVTEPVVKMKATRPPPKEKPISHDNFIRLNMKLKTYKRKGHHMTGPQYKRKMWKEKMQARSKSYGDACFKCGQSGHWASKCPGAGKQAANPYDKEPVQDEDFPSMQEAAMLARGIKPEQRPAASPAVKKVKESAKPCSSPDKEGALVRDVEEEDEELTFQTDIVRSRSEKAAPPPCMRPLIECGDGETLPATPKFVLDGLKKFGFDKFRPGQEEAVMRILAGLSTLVVLSTGGGKSLCYKLPAYLYSQREPCICLVISPLVSLMEDQVTGLPQGVRGFCLHTNMTPSQREAVLAKVKEGQAQFLLVSPEAIAGGSMSLITSMASLPPVAFVCIDEAHCLSEWSHNFRPSYLRLCKVLKEKLGVQCFLGLTATATLSTAADVSRHLGITDIRRATVRGSPIPGNLYLSVSRDENRDEALIGLLQGERFGSLDCIIVYCTRRDVTERVATVIRTCMNKVPLHADKGKGRRKVSRLEWDAESYHAGMTGAKRKSVQNAFMSGRLRVVVATVAFGMGLDKSDVRGIIHYNMPKSFESYVQEIGRAGRDGLPAQCHVFLDPEGKDLCELRRHTYANTVDYKTLKKLVSKVFPSCRCQEVHQRHEQARREAQTSEAMMDDDYDEDFLQELDSKTHHFNNKPGLEGCDKVDGEPDTVELSADRTKTAFTDNTICVVSEETNKIKSNISNSALVNNEYEPMEEAGLQEDKAETSGGTIKGPDASIPVSSNKDVTKTGTSRRVCQGHERALPIQQTVMELDVKEEGIATMLCYLELHSHEWLENLSHVYSQCKIQCYGGPHQLQAVAKKCPPVAIAIAQARRRGEKFDQSKSVEFSVVEVSDMMGWDSGPVKKELKLLQWDFSQGAVPRRTGVMVEFSDLAFHFRSLGDFSLDEYDDILQFLHSRMQRQERSELVNLSQLHRALKSVSHGNYYMCSAEVDQPRNNKLKAILNEYFDKQSQDEDLPVNDSLFQDEPVPPYSRDQVVSDVRQFYSMYAQEHAVTGRAIARIFHGIASPCFPATTWGRVRRFWRSHLDVDFNELMKLATQELVRMRS